MSSTMLQMVEIRDLKDDMFYKLKRYFQRNLGRDSKLSGTGKFGFSLIHFFLPLLYIIAFAIVPKFTLAVTILALAAVFIAFVICSLIVYWDEK